MRARSVARRIEGFLEIPAVVGFERPFVDALAQEFAGAGLSVERHDGLLVLRGDGPGTVSAHIDRHGLVRRGDLLVYAAADAKARRYDEALHPGARQRAAICGRFADEPVFAYDPSTGERIAQGTIRHEQLCLLADAELALRADGLDGLPDGTPVAFSHRCVHEDGAVRGQLDNVASVAVIADLFDHGFRGTALLTTEEEIGHSWEHLTAWFDRDGPVSDLVVLDTSPFDDPGPVDDGVVVLRGRDANGVFDAGLVDRAKSIAAAAGVPVVVKDEILAEAGRPLGSTELGRLVSGTDGAVTGATVQLATTDYHTNEETTSLLALEHMLAVLDALVGG